MISSSPIVTETICTRVSDSSTIPVKGFSAPRRRCLCSYWPGSKSCVRLALYGDLSGRIQSGAGGFVFVGSCRYDGPELLGTGGASRIALSELGEAFFTIYGDSYLPCDFARIKAAFNSSKKPALMTIFYNANRWDRSNVFYKNGRFISYDKRDPDPDAQHIDYGVGVFLARAIEAYPLDNRLDLGRIY